MALPNVRAVARLAGVLVIRPGYAYHERPSGPGWRCTYYDATGPIASVWRLDRNEAFAAVTKAVGELR
jgi:hypothetical protein